MNIGGVIPGVVCNDFFIVNEKISSKCQAVFLSLRPVLQLKRFPVEIYLVLPDSLNELCKVPIPFPGAGLGNPEDLFPFLKDVVPCIVPESEGIGPDQGTISIAFFSKGIIFSMKAVSKR